MKIENAITRSNFNRRHIVIPWFAKLCIKLRSSFYMCVDSFRPQIKCYTTNGLHMTIG